LHCIHPSRIGCCNSLLVASHPEKGRETMTLTKASRKMGLTSQQSDNASDSSCTSLPDV
jgi:hypothetical protein